MRIAEKTAETIRNLYKIFFTGCDAEAYLVKSIANAPKSISHAKSTAYLGVYPYCHIIAI